MATLRRLAKTKCRVRFVRWYFQGSAKSSFGNQRWIMRVSKCHLTIKYTAVVRNCACKTHLENKGGGGPKTMSTITAGHNMTLAMSEQ